MLTSPGARYELRYTFSDSAQISFLQGEEDMRPFRLLSIVLAIGLLAAACTSATLTAPATSAPVAAPATSAPAQAPAAEQNLPYLPASLTDAFNEIGKSSQAEPWCDVEFNYAGSQQLRTQLEQGAAADVFASANTKEMNTAIQAGLVISGTQKTFVHNRLTVIVPQDNPGDITALKDLARPGLKIVFAAAGVPVGGYSLTALDKMNADFGATFSQTVLSNVVSTKTMLSKWSRKFNSAKAMPASCTRRM
jgi:molybdate transport system substrate-binding protein